MKGEGGSVVDWLRGPSSWNGDREKGRAEGVNGEDCAHQECCDVSADFIRGRGGRSQECVWVQRVQAAAAAAAAPLLEL